MAYVIVSGTGFNFRHLFQFSLNDTALQSSLGVGTTNELIIQSPVGWITTLQGIGFVYDIDGNLISGAISDLIITGNAGAPIATITDLSLEVPDLLNMQSQNYYGSVLGNSWSLEATNGNPISTDSFGGKDWSDIIWQTTGEFPSRLRIVLTFSKQRAVTII